MKRLFFLVTLIMGVTIAKAQSSKYSVNELVLSDSGILIMMDKAFQFEKSCSYYSDTLFYNVSIDTFDSKDSIIIKVEANNDIRSMFYYNKPIAFLKYKSHILFFYIEKIQPKIFTLSKQYETFVINGDYEVFIDDSWNLYYFAVVPDKYLFLGSVINCSQRQTYWNTGTNHKE